MTTSTQTHRSHQNQSRRRSRQEWANFFPKYPMDADGFAQTLSWQEPQRYREALAQHGVVVLRGVFSAETCAGSINALFDEVNSLASPERHEPVDRNDALTWDNHNWPTPKSPFLMAPPALHAQAFANRTSERMYAIFCELWQESRLCVSVDRWGIARGTRGVRQRNEQGRVVRGERPDWEAALRVHWDYNPWAYVEAQQSGRELGIQAFVALNDQPSGSGCHLTLPGGVRALAAWCQEHPPKDDKQRNRRGLFRPRKKDPILHFIQELPVRAGDMVVWSGGQLHGTAPNHSSNMRLVQYIRMFPSPQADPTVIALDAFAPQNLEHRAPGFDLGRVAHTPRARRLLGLERW